MTRAPNIFFERERWAGPLRWSAALHAVIFGAIIFYAYKAGQQGAVWGEGGQGSVIGATLVSSAVPLPANPVITNNLVANPSHGISYSEIKSVEQTPEAVPIPAPATKPKSFSARQRPRIPPPPRDNTVPYGEGGPVSGPYTMFSTPDMRGGLSFGGSGEFGQTYGWYVGIVRSKISENWLKYEVDPSISAAHRVYLTFDILRDGSPTNVQIEQSSGVPSLDQSAVRALERIDTFGPLPPGYSGSRVSVEFWFDYRH